MRRMAVGRDRPKEVVEQVAIVLDDPVLIFTTFVIKPFNIQALINRVHGAV